MLLVLEIMALLFALTFIFVGIWGFILMHRIYNQIKYKNYLMEKIIENIGCLSKKDILTETAFISKKEA